MKEIDARGQNCPIPVILAKKEMDAGERAFSLRVDNQTAVENLKRLGDSQGFATQIGGGEGDFTLTFHKNGAPAPSVQTPPACAAGGGSWAVFVPRDIIGDGERELGTNLMRMYFYALSQSDDLPAAVLFMNAGVRLPVEDDQVVEHLKVLADRGVEILVCGTCLNFYGLSQGLKLGTVSNMYDIMGRMQAAAKVITL